MIDISLNWLDKIIKSINFEKLPHGLIINGPNGIGKEFLSREIASRLLLNKTTKTLDKELYNIPEEQAKNCFIKIDVQGYEKEVLKGAENLLKKADSVEELLTLFEPDFGHFWAWDVRPEVLKQAKQAWGSDEQKPYLASRR